MNKNLGEKKKLFVMRETLVDLTPDLMRQVQIQGASCIGVSTSGFDLKNYTVCPQSSYTTK